MRLRRLSFNRGLFGVLWVGLNAGYQHLAYPAGRPLATPQVTLLANCVSVLIVGG